MYAVIFEKAWEMMQNTITVNGFTFSYAEVFIFHLILIFIVRFISILFLLKGD